MTKGSTQRGKNLLKVKRMAGVREILTKRVVIMEMADPNPRVLNIISGKMAKPMKVPGIVALLLLLFYYSFLTPYFLSFFILVVMMVHLGDLF